MGKISDKTFFLYSRYIKISRYIAYTNIYHMKKIYQLGFIASLVALLPTGLLFAGNNDGDGKDTKNTVSINSSASTDRIVLVFHTNSNLTKDDFTVNSKTDYSNISEINPVSGGFEVIIDVQHATESSANGEDEVIIIEIVGVDNITGVDATDGNTGNTVPTNISAPDKFDQVAGSNNNNTGNGLHQNPDGNHQGTSTNTNPVFNTGHKDDITIYPNPVREEANVVTVGEILGKEIQIIDLSGNVVMNMIIPANSLQTVLNLSMLTPGLYILSYTLEDGRVISKRIQKV